ncbi:uncharacterized protein LOC141601650 [Silene latifolia]|uniref:uncharacterized protein LOC141601650 n=1 Tax=Silene latifolia TaxID=37657 RepID=UPI003D77B87E
MKLLSLNCMGLGNPDAVGGLRNLLRREAPDLVFLCETKLSGSEFRRVRPCLTDYEDMEVDSVGRSRGLAFLWRKAVSCSFRLAYVHYMDFDVSGEGIIWRVTGFYGWPMVSDRHLSWELLRVLGAENGASPWLCIGDFNEILFATEMKGGNHPQWQMNNFREAVDDCGLKVIGFEGYEFTYDNRQEDGDNRKSIIDRAMGNAEWFDMFPRAKLFHMDRERSDHAPIKVILQPRVDRDMGSGRLFRFEHIWVSEDGCEKTIRNAWEMGNEELVDTIAACSEEL